MSDLFDRARRAMRLETYAAGLMRGGKLSGSGDERRSYCPLCKAGEKSGSQPFKVEVGKQKWQCFTCNEHGDVIDLYALCNSMSGYEAAQELAGQSASRPDFTRNDRQADTRPEGEDQKAARILKRAVDTWRATGPLLGTIGETYLLARGVIPELVAQIDGLRFHPNAKHHWDGEAGAWVCAPALVCKAQTTAGWDGGVHVTYLAADGLGKAALDPAKKMLGPQFSTTPSGRLPAGAWLIGQFAAGGDLVVGEGCETTLGLASHLWRQGKRDLRVSAALSLNRLQGAPQRDNDGCIDARRLVGDPARPPFLWPPCDTGADAPGFGVFLAIDRDMGPIVIKGRDMRGRVMWFEMGAEARANLCARLARLAWLRAGWSFVNPMRPQIGSDWGDMARGAA